MGPARTGPHWSPRRCRTPLPPSPRPRPARPLAAADDAHVPAPGQKSRSFSAPCCWCCSCSQLAGRREAVKNGGTILGGGEQQPAEILQGAGLVQPANPDRVVASVGDELRGGRIRRAVGGVEAAGPFPRG